MGKQQDIVVIGAGIGGLTAGALLAQAGHRVTVLEQADVTGGCASTFKRRGFTFDVGATQVAGLEPGGIHHRIFQILGLELPPATLCDPACAVFLPGETEPISIWRDRAQWQAERQRQFPGSERFWQLLNLLFEASWQFQSRDPVLPVANGWDLGQLLQALRWDTLITVPFARMTVGDALRLCGCGGDRRLKQFLDLQLKLYSQVNGEETALLYAATALAVSQEPQGLYHLQGSMQVLSDRLELGLKNHGGQLHRGQRVTAIAPVQDGFQIQVCDRRSGKTTVMVADQVVANTTVQDLLDLTPDPEPWQLPQQFFKQRVENLPAPSGAFVVYLGVHQEAIPDPCPPHLQFFYDPAGPIGENNSLFVSVSKPGDGRAPEGKATIIASSFVDPDPWFQDSEAAYQERKQAYTATAIAKLGQYFDLKPENIVVTEAGTPRTFAHYTARKQGFVGGIGQRLNSFGPFGLATRTPLKNLWLVGDSTHPGEGTAGVSYSALTIARQIQAQQS